MNEVLLVAVIALAISLLSIVINLMLVFKISNLKDHVEWIEKAPIDSLNIRDNILNDKITKLGKDTKDAFEKVTNHLTIHDDQIDKLIENYGEAEIQVAKNTEQLDQLGRFAGITTGELRVLEQKIYNISKNEPDYMCKWVSDAEKKLIEIDRIKESIENKRNYIEESRNRVDIKAQNDELFGIRQRVSILEKKLEDFQVHLANYYCSRYYINNKKPKRLITNQIIGTPGRNRTYDQKLRSLLLYPTELPGLKLLLL